MNWRILANEPNSFARGWAQFLYAPWLGKSLIWGGDSHNPLGNNCARLYDPIKNSWETIYPNNNGTAGLQNRDNYFGFLVPKLGEFWVIGGAGGQNHGRFNIAERAWVEVTNFSNSTMVQDFGNFRNLFPTAHGYSPECDTFLMTGTFLHQWIEPNPTGPKPYRLRSAAAPFGTREHNGNSAAAVGAELYFYGGSLPTGAQRDFYKVDFLTRAVTRLPDAPWTVYRPALTYDSKRHVLVLHGGSYTRNTAIFDIARGKWADITSVMALVPWTKGMRPMKNQGRTGCYCPNVDLHLRTGGGCRPDGSTPEWTYSLTLDGLQLGAADGDTTAPERPGRPRLKSIEQSA